LGKVSLTEKAHYYPFGLSGGQQQRVAIARALAMAPKVMLYDEPTSALDTVLVEGLLDLMRELRCEGMTQLIVTHDRSIAQKIADRVILFDKGRVVGSGAPGVLLGMDRPEKEVL
jgi:ABC-type polar amino acid transport system ATPase subunit